MPTVLFDAVKQVVEPLWVGEEQKRTAAGQTLVDAVLWTICYLEAQNIIDQFSTKDLARELRHGGIQPIDTPEVAEEHLLTMCTEIHEDGDVYTNDAYKTDEGWEGYIESVEKFWKE